MKNLYLIASLLFLLTACNNLEDATLRERNTFMHFYEGANSYLATSAEIAADGYIIAGTITLSDPTVDSKIILIKTDFYGQKIWEKIIDGGSASAVKVTSNGYLIIGDSIEYNVDSDQISNLINNWSRLIEVDNNKNIVSDISFSQKRFSSGDTSHIDFHGNAITFNQQGHLITLGTFKIAGSSEFAYVAALDPSSLDTLWQKTYNYINRDYANTKSVFYNTAGNVVWGTSVQTDFANFNRSYVSIPVIKDSSVFVNSDYYGETTDQSFVIMDMQPSPHGYGVIGTFAQPDGSKSNLFFIRVDHNGNFKKETARYFDGVASQANEVLSDSTVSTTEDTGNALTSTRDGGYILAGTITTTPQLGNGGKDIWLIKVDGTGKPLWNKLIGASTDETVSSIRETADGGFLICGTKTLGGLSSIFLFKTDSNGELKN